MSASDSVSIRQCQLRQCQHQTVSASDSVSIRQCQHQTVSASDNVSSDSVSIRQCQHQTVSASDNVSIRQCELRQCQHQTVSASDNVSSDNVSSDSVSIRQCQHQTVSASVPAILSLSMNELRLLRRTCVGFPAVANVSCPAETSTIYLASDDDYSRNSVKGEQSQSCCTGWVSKVIVKTSQLCRLSWG